MTTSKLKCPQCGKEALYKNKETQGCVCMNCSKEIKGTHEMHLFIQANGKEIAKDYLEMTTEEVLYKWGISNSALYRISEIIEIRANKPKSRGRPHLIAPKSVKADNRSNEHLPQFPIFSNDWASEVQLKWLDIYEIILTKERVALPQQ